MISESEYLVLLSSFIPLGAKRVTLLVDYLGSAQKVWEASNNELSDVGLSRDIVGQFVQYRKLTDPTAFFKILRSLDIKYLTLDNPNYPDKLKAIDNAPITLFYKGEMITQKELAIAVVGSRKISEYGHNATNDIVGDLAKSGIIIISGLAFGIDYQAHKSALENGGRCIAVLASGVDVITPRTNEWLGREILKRGGALISEYPPQTVPQKYFFPYRNRIISGLSSGVLIIEGKIKSGTMHTANAAATQGKEVYALPGSINETGSELPNYLIKNGAKLITCAEDILNELNPGAASTVNFSRPY